jgi:DNA processing protein
LRSNGCTTTFSRKNRDKRKNIGLFRKPLTRLVTASLQRATPLTYNVDKGVGPYGCNAAGFGAGPFALNKRDTVVSRDSRIGSTAPGGRMNLHTAVAVSMLGISRLRVCSVFRDLRQQEPDISVEALVEALQAPEAERHRLIVEACSRADVALSTGASAGMDVVPWFDSRFPALLNCTPDAPPVLWIRGSAGALSRPAVAIVGSRAATTYALDVGRRLAGELAERGVVVVSGLARGVDSSAHRGCLDEGGATVAVLGSGLDRIYPPEHGDLAQVIAGQGVVVSELGPGAVPVPENFPLRNRIISGISLAVVVVEASEKSGSLITARCAMEQGRDVMAVPGSVLTGRNRGSHSLLKDGAKVVETADDILEELGWPGARTGIESAKQLISDPLLARMEPGEVYRLEELAGATAMAPSKLLPRLMELELQGHVVAAGGGRFTRSASATVVRFEQVWQRH